MGVMSDYEITKARQDLMEIRDDLYKYLKRHYPEDKKDQADKVFKYLEKVVTQVIKRQKVSITWGSGATPCWHSTVLLFLSSWIEAETRLSNAICDALK